MNDPKRFWNKLSATYDASVERRYRTAYERSVELAQRYLTNEMVALDFACGTGITTVALAEKVARIDAIDIADGMIAAATAKSAAKGIHNLRFMVADIDDPALVPGTYDVVMAFNILLFCDAPPRTLYRIRQLLKPRGILISTTDCYAEHGVGVRLLASALMRLWLMPRARLFTCASLEATVRAAGFTILWAERLHAFPANQFIAAQSQDSARTGP
jgi:2-polyprenyl-3-methyl-5-hydroxy-6-metoxy-1,4-benzoquinol methylase